MIRVVCMQVSNTEAVQKFPDLLFSRRTYGLVEWNGFNRECVNSIEWISFKIVSELVKSGIETEM